MNKKTIIFIIIFLIIALLLIAGGIFWWRESQKEIRKLNKNLPEGIRVIKSLTGEYWFISTLDGKEVKMIKIIKEKEKYKIINDRYEYKFILPKDRMGLWRIDYQEKVDEKEMEYICKLCKKASILFLGLIERGRGDQMILEAYIPTDKNIELDLFTKEGNPTWLHRAEVEKTKIGGLDVIKVKSGPFWRYYFFKVGAKIYKIEHVSEDFLNFVIMNGEW